MDVYKFELQGYSGSIKGINGRILPVDDVDADNRKGNDNDNDDEQPIAQSCVLELVHKDTLRLWRKTVKKEELDGMVVKEMPHIVESIQNALDDTYTRDIKVSAIIKEEMSGNLALILSFPCIFGPASLNFSLEEIAQDEMSILAKRVDLLTGPVRVLARRVDVLNGRVDLSTDQVKENSRKFDSLASRFTVMEHKNNVCRGNGCFAESGTNLHISRCGKIVTNKSPNTWATAVTGETMSRGKHLVKFTTLRMSMDYCMYCGVVPPNSELNKHIGAIQGGFGFNLHNRSRYQAGTCYFDTGLPGCKGSSGTAIVNVVLDLDDNKIQFSLNGMETKKFDISPGQYTFAVSLYTQWDSAKLKIYKQM